MAIIEMDYMEYATDGAAQAAYVSSDAVTRSNADIADIDCSSLDGWTDGDSGNGVSSQVTFDGKSCFKLDTVDIAALHRARRTKDVGSVPTIFAVTIKTYHTNIGIAWEEGMQFRINRGDMTLLGSLGTDGLFVNDGVAYNEVGTDLVQEGVWQEWTFLVDATTPASATCDVYLNGVSVATGVDCSRTETNTDGLVVVTQWGQNSINLTYIDYIKVGSALVTPLQCYSEDTIINQGTYSLEVVAQQTYSLNDTLTKSGLSIDLSGRDELKIDFYALRTGTNIQVQIHDSGGTTSTKDIAISSSNEWETTTWDISGISDANKDDIDSIIIKIINADADNTFYVDNFYAPEANLELYDINNDFRNAILVLKDINNKFNSLPYATEGLYDYFEYATDEIAQSNYVSSDFETLPTSEYSSDTYTKLLLHCNGADESTTISDSGNTNHGNASIVGDAQLDTAQKKFETASLLLYGTGDYITFADHDDWNFGAGDFTIDFWMRMDDLPGTGLSYDFMLQYADDSNYWVFKIDEVLPYHNARLFVRSGGNTIIDFASSGITWYTDIWYHIALVRNGNSWDIYKDGISIASTTDTDSMPDIAGDLWIGCWEDGFSSAFDGWMDEIRISKGIARWTSDFNLPNLQCYSEDTTKQQGSYALKIQALQTYSLNDTLTKSGLAFNLSNKDTLKLWVRADRTGTNLQARIQDLGGTWSTKDINITQINTWQEITWDISGISDANKDYIVKIEFKILNADSDTIYYIDNFSSEILELIDINNDFRNAILELEDVSNDFRFLLEIIENIDNKFNTVLEVKEDVSNDFRNAIKTLKNISNDIRTGKETITNVSNDFRSVVETLLNLNNRFNMSLEVKKDIINDFRSLLGLLTDITNDFRLRKLELENVSNDFRMFIGGLFGINNDFRSAIEVITDITNDFRTLKAVVEDLDNKFNFALRILSDANVKFAFALGALIDFNNDVRTHKLVIYNVNNNFRMIRSYQVPVPPEVGIQALGRSYFTVKINGVDKTSILDLDSLSWKETLNSSNTASFILGVPYDSVSCPTENQTVEILFNNHRKFYGYITNITKVSDPEGIQVSAEDEYWNLNKTEVDFKVGRTIVGDHDTYYLTIESALSALGFNVGIGNFIPVTMSLVGSKADVISQLVQESGNFQWFIKPDGTKKLWQADKGDIVNLEKQVIGTNLGLYQVINHNIVKDSSGIVNKFKVIMGDDIIPGYNNEFRFAYISQNYEQKSPEYMEAFHDGEPYSESQRRHISSIQWYDKRRNIDTNAYEAIINIPLIGDGFRITVPSGMIKGYPLKYKAVYDIGVSWEIDVLSENTKVSYSSAYWYDRGGIYPECRRDRTFEVTLGTYPQTIVKDLVLSNLNVQYGTNYRVWEGHNWSYSKEYERSELPPLPEPAKYIVNRTGAYITQKSFKISSWNDVAYATDHANWQLSKNCDIKEKGTIAITMDCAYFYGLDLSKRINISGVTSNPLNIVAISYDVRNYLVTINVESARAYTRTVSVPVHIREE